MKINSLAQVLSLEGEDLYEEEEIGEDEEGINEDISEASTDVDEAMSDIASSDTVTDNLVADADTLEEVGEVVDDSLESGEGMSDEEALDIQETVESIYRRHGMPRKAYPSFPSLESYDSRSQRIMATRQLKVSIEGVIDTIKEGIRKAIEATKNFFSGLWDRFKTFENRLLAGFRRLKAASKKASPLNNDAITISAIKDFSSNNSTVTLSEVTGAFNSFANVIKSQRFHKIIEDIQNGLDSDLAAWEGEEEPSTDEKPYKHATENKENSKLAGAVLTSAFSDINKDTPDAGKASAMKFASARDFQNACDSAIDLLSMKPLAQMKKASDNLFTFMLKSAKAWFSDKIKKENSQKADKGLKYTGDGQTASAKQVFKQTISSYKYIMYKNISVYKETIGCFYEIVDELLNKQGVRTPDVE